jgi:hypothetical protein
MHEGGKGYNEKGWGISGPRLALMPKAYETHNSALAGPQKHGGSRWTFVPISSTI